MHNSPRITECPHCNTAFRVTEAQLRAAKGAVRCGSCLEVFLAHQHWLSEDEQTAELELDDWGDDANAMFAELEQLDRDLENSIDDESWALKLLEEEAAETVLSATERKQSVQPEITSAPVFVVINENDDESDSYTDSNANASLDNTSTLSDRDTTITSTEDEWLNPPFNASREPDLFEDDPEEPRFETELDKLDALIQQNHYATKRNASQKTGAFLPDWLAALIIVLSIIGLGAQYLFHNLNALSQMAQWRSTTETFCAITGCNVPEWRDLQSIQHDNLVVRSHPQQANALLINVRLINNSEFAQTFPLLELRFSDLNGNEIASRRFKPEEYLAGELSGLKKMPVNQAIQIELALVDPGKAAVNYQMQLLNNP